MQVQVQPPIRPLQCCASNQTDFRHNFTFKLNHNLSTVLTEVLMLPQPNNKQDSEHNPAPQKTASQLQFDLRRQECNNSIHQMYIVRMSVLSFSVLLLKMWMMWWNIKMTHGKNYETDKITKWKILVDLCMWPFYFLRYYFD